MFTKEDELWWIHAIVITLILMIIFFLKVNEIEKKEDSLSMLICLFGCLGMFFLEVSVLALFVLNNIR